MAAWNEITRTHYYVNQYEDNPQPGWKQYLHAIYTKKHPELHLTEQNPVDRKNSTVKERYLAATDLGYIKREVAQFVIEISNPEIKTQPPDTASGKFYHLLEFYWATDPTMRPKIPILKNVKKVKEKM
jgi:hypothetical protein